MANNVNPINLNLQAINYAKMRGAENKPEAPKEDVVKDSGTGAEQKSVAANDVLNYMAAQNIDLKPTNAIPDVAKYVTQEQALRIAGFVQGFESAVAQGLKEFNAEYAGVPLSDDAKLTAAVMAFEKANM